MFGFMLGTMCLVGLFGVWRGGMHRYHWHHGRHGYGGHRGYGGHPGRGWEGGHAEGAGRGSWFMGEGFGRAAAEMVKRRLRVDEDQADIVDHAMKDVRASVKEYVEVLKGSRTELGAAFRGEAVDEASIAALFARHDDELARARREVVSAFKQIHAVLTPDQRKTAADWLGSADSRWV